MTRRVGRHGRRADLHRGRNRYLFLAIDIETGEVFWADTLPAGGQANPISHEVDGRQYVLIAPGGHHFMQTGVSDVIIYYALPE